MMLERPMSTYPTPQQLADWLRTRMEVRVRRREEDDDWISVYVNVHMLKEASSAGTNFGGMEELLLNYDLPQEGLVVAEMFGRWQHARTKSLPESDEWVDIMSTVGQGPDEPADVDLHPEFFEDLDLCWRVECREGVLFERSETAAEASSSSESED